MAKAPRKAPGSKTGSKKGAPSGGATPKGSKPKGGKPKSSAKLKPTKSPSVQGKTYEILCSECYTSYAISTTNRGSAVSCPECLHIGHLAEQDVMSKIALAKSTEQGNLMKALIPGILFFLCGTIWAMMAASAATGGDTLSPGANYGFLGATLIFFFVAIGFGVKYESGRYEVYF